MHRVLPVFFRRQAKLRAAPFCRVLQRDTVASMLRKLLDITETLEFEENGRLLIQAATWSDDSVDLRFRVDHGTDETSIWTLHCSEVIEYLLADVRYQIGLNIHSGDHPLIKQYEI